MCGRTPQSTAEEVRAHLVDSGHDDNGPARAVAYSGPGPRFRVEEADAPPLTQPRSRDGNEGDAGREQAPSALGGLCWGESGAGGGDEGGVAGIDIHGGAGVLTQPHVVQQLVKGAFACARGGA